MVNGENDLRWSRRAEEGPTLINGAALHVITLIRGAGAPFIIREDQEDDARGRETEGQKHHSTAGAVGLGGCGPCPCNVRVCMAIGPPGLIRRT
jgi:hypothetical protein